MPAAASTAVNSALLKCGYRRDIGNRRTSINRVTPNSCSSEMNSWLVRVEWPIVKTAFMYYRTRLTHPGAHMRAVLVFLFSLLAATDVAAQDPRFANKRVPFEPGFRVYFIVDMEGMGSAVHTREVIAGNEGERYRDRTGPDYWNHYRGLLTDEVNASIAGARAAGARSFVINEGHGGNLFA